MHPESSRDYCRAMAAAHPRSERMKCGSRLGKPRVGQSIVTQTVVHPVAISPPMAFASL